MNNYNQGYYQNPLTQPFSYPQYQYQQPQMQQPIQPQINKIQPIEPFSRLQGKSVDSIDVVKAMDIPLDGSISYFPLTDGSAIVTKQLQQDGTSKTLIYKVAENETVEATNNNYLTIEEFNKAMENNSKEDVKDDIKILKRKMQELTEDIKDINEYISKRKDK